MKILYITSSILKEYSVSNALCSETLAHVQSKYPSATVIKRDLGINPPAHLTLAVATAIRSKETASLNDTQRKEHAAILESIKELKEADLVIIGSPMYNLTVSSGLKTWVDQIAQAGLTFKYTEKGPEGLVNNKPLILVSSRGGIYSVPPVDVLDHQESYLKAVFGLIGINNISIIRAEGTNISEQAKQEAIKKAQEAIKQLKI